MSENKKFICIRCPQGCEIQTTIDGKNVTSISGNTCKLGEEYVKNEASDPKRTVTSLVGVRTGVHPVCPVWTTKPIPKALVTELMQVLRKKVIDAPIRMGDIILRDFHSTGADVAASRDIPTKGPVK